MPTFIIRSQGFFYTDEYYAPGEVFRQVVKSTFETRAAAEEALAALVRRWVRSEPIGNYVFDDNAKVDAILEYLRKVWPEEFEGCNWLFDAKIPAAATDDQVDEIVKRMGVTFANVFEVDGSTTTKKRQKGFDDDLHFGPPGEDGNEEEIEDNGDDEDQDEGPPEYREGEPVPAGYAVAINPFTKVKILVPKRT